MIYIGVEHSLYNLSRPCLKGQCDRLLVLFSCHSKRNNNETSRKVPPIPLLYNFPLPLFLKHIAVGP